MKLHVLHDRQGRILAASGTAADNMVVPRPVATDSEHTAVELEVPQEYRDMSLLEICTRLRVDPARNQFVPREAKE